MTLLKFVAAALVALVASTAAVDHAQAQTAAFNRSQGDRQSMRDREHLERPSRESDRRTNRRGHEPSATEVMASAQAVATTAGLSCQVSESKLLGVTNDNKNMYEVACNEGGGYILTDAAPPQTFECIVLAAQAEQIRAAGGTENESRTCALPGNQDPVAVVANYARAAGISCQVDAGRVAGATADGNMVYEVGCANADGYHIERAGQTWKKTDCMQIMSTNMKCEFTTAEEQVAGFKALLPGTAIDDCDAQRLHVLGQNDTGRFVEVKCASGDGYVARIKENAIDQVYPCAISGPIGGGCTMSPVEGAPAPAAAAATNEQ